MTDKAKPEPAKTEKAKAVKEPEKVAGIKSSQEVEIYPLRSYLDAGEIKRRGGPSYTVPRRHADALIAQGMASPEKPKA